jgi:hypothetical protein
MSEEFSPEFMELLLQEASKAQFESDIEVARQKEKTKLKNKVKLLNKKIKELTAEVAQRRDFDDLALIDEMHKKQAWFEKYKTEHQQLIHARLRIDLLETASSILVEENKSLINEVRRLGWVDDACDQRYAEMIEARKWARYFYRLLRVNP